MVDSIRRLLGDQAVPRSVEMSEQNARARGTDSANLRRRALREQQFRQQAQAVAPTEIPTTPKEGFIDNFLGGLAIGSQQLSGDVERFGAIVNFYLGDEEATQQRLENARIIDQSIEAIGKDLEPFSNVVNGPTISNLVNATGKALGQFTPMALTSIASGFTGAAASLLGRYSISNAGRAALGEVISGTLRKKVLRGEALDDAERLVLNAAQGVGKVATTGGLSGSFAQEYLVGASQSLSEFEDAGIKLTREEFNSAVLMGIPQGLMGATSDALFATSLYKLAFKRSAIGRLREKEAKIEMDAKLTGQESKLKLNDQEKELKRIADKVRTKDVRNPDALSVLTPEERRIYQAAIGTTPSLQKLMKDIAIATGISGGTEGATEFLQEEMFIDQRTAVDPNYSEQEKGLRRMEAAFGGFVAGGGRAAITSPVTSVFRQAREFTDLGNELRSVRDTRREFTEEAIDIEDNQRLAANIGQLTGAVTEDQVIPPKGQPVTVPEPEAQLRAQFRSMQQGDKPSMFVPENTATREFVDNLVSGSTPEVFQAVVPGVGTYLSTNKAKIDNVFQNKEDLMLLNSDRYIAEFLGYSGAKRDEHDRVVVVRDSLGNVVSEETTDSSMVDLAIRKAEQTYILNREEKGYTVSVEDPADVLQDRQNAAKIEKAKKGQQSFDFQTRGSIDDIDMDDPEQLQALTDATDPNAQGGVVEVANLEETYDPAEYDQEVVNVIDENIENTGSMNASRLGGREEVEGLTAQGVRGGTSFVPLSKVAETPVNIETARNKQGEPFAESTKQTFIDARERYTQELTNDGEFVLRPSQEELINSLPYQIIDKFFDVQAEDPDGQYTIVNRGSNRLGITKVGGRATADVKTGKTILSPRGTVLQAIVEAEKDAQDYKARDGSIRKSETRTEGEYKGAPFKWVSRSPNKKTRDKPINMNRLLFAGRDVYLQEEDQNVSLDTPYLTQIALGFYALVDVLTDENQALGNNPADGFFTKRDSNKVTDVSTKKQFILTTNDREFDLTNPEDVQELYDQPIFWNNSVTTDENGVDKKVGYQSINELANYRPNNNKSKQLGTIENLFAPVKTVMSGIRNLRRRLFNGDPLRNEKPEGLDLLDRQRQREREPAPRDKQGNILPQEVTYDVPSLRNVGNLTGRKEVLKVTSYTEEEFKLPKEVTTIVVAGSRRIQGSPFNNYEVVKDTLDLLIGDRKDITIMHGGAIGADRLGGRYAEEKKLPVALRKADFKGRGPSAGYDRNIQMIQEAGSGYVNERDFKKVLNRQFKPPKESAGAVVVFWDGKSGGTQQMIRKSIFPPKEKEFRFNPLKVYYVSIPDTQRVNNAFDVKKIEVVESTVEDTENDISISFYGGESLNKPDTSAPAQTVLTPKRSREDAEVITGGVQDRRFGLYEDIVAALPDDLKEPFQGLGNAFNRLIGGAAKRVADEEGAPRKQREPTISIPSINIWAANDEAGQLSNLAPRPFTFDTRRYFSVEHAYQTLKTGKFNKAIYQNEGWQFGGKYPLPLKDPALPNTELNAQGVPNNVALMEELMFASFDQNAEAKQDLLATGGSLLTHYQSRDMWSETFPKLLMKIRKRLGGEDINVERIAEVFKRDIAFVRSPDLGQAQDDQNNIVVNRLEVPIVEYFDRDKEIPRPKETARITPLTFLGVVPTGKELLALTISAAYANTLSNTKVGNEPSPREAAIDKIVDTFEEDLIKRANSPNRGYSIDEVILPIPEENKQEFRDIVEDEIKKRIGYIRSLLKDGKESLPRKYASALEIELSFNAPVGEYRFENYPTLSQKDFDQLDLPGFGSQDIRQRFKRMLNGIEDFTVKAQEELALATDEFVDTSVTSSGGLQYTPEGQIIGDREQAGFDSVDPQIAVELGGDVPAGMFEQAIKQYNQEARGGTFNPAMGTLDVSQEDLNYQEQFSRDTDSPRQRAAKQERIDTINRADAEAEVQARTIGTVKSGVSFTKKVSEIFTSNTAGIKDSGETFMRGFVQALRDSLGLDLLGADTIFIADNDENFVLTDLASNRTTTTKAVFDKDGRPVMKDGRQLRETTVTREPILFTGVPVRRSKQLRYTRKFKRRIQTIRKDFPDFQPPLPADPKTQVSEGLAEPAVTRDGTPFFKGKREITVTKQVTEQVFADAMGLKIGDYYQTTELVDTLNPAIREKQKDPLTQIRDLTPMYDTVTSIEGTAQAMNYIRGVQTSIRENPNPEAAKVIKFGNKNVVIVKSLDPNRRTEREVFSRMLAMIHEAGHIFLWTQQEQLLRPGTNTTGRNKLLDKLQAAYERDRQNLDEPYYEGERGFEEWFADQFTKAIVQRSGGTLGSRPSTVQRDGKDIRPVTAYFRNIAIKLENFMKKISGLFQKRFKDSGLNYEFNNFMQVVRDKYREKNRSGNDGVIPANTVFAVRDAIKGVQESQDTIVQSAKDVAQKTKYNLKAPRSSRSHWSWRYLIYPADNTMAYYAEKLANTPRERAAIKKLQKSTYTRSRTRREAVGTSFLNLHPNANAKVYNAFTEIFGLKDPTFLDQDERDMVMSTLLKAENYRDYPDLNLLRAADPKAVRVRNFLEAFYRRYLRDNGIKHLKKFFPRSLDMFALRQDKNGERAALAALLAEKNPQAKIDWDKFVANLLIEDDALIDNIDDDAINGERGEDLTDIAVGGKRERSVFFKNIDNSELRELGGGEFSVLKDPIEAVREYFNAMVKRNLYNRAYTTRYEDISPSARQILEDKKIFFTNEEKRQDGITGWKAIEAELAEIQATNPQLEVKVRHLLKGMLGKAGQDMSSGFRNLNSFFLFFNSITLLTLAPLASLPDLAGPMLFSSDKDAFKDMRQVLKQYFTEEGGKDALRSFAFDVGVVSADSLSMYYINAAEQNYMTPMFRKGTDYFFRYTGLEGFTMFSRVFATGMARQFLVRAADAAKKGDRVKAEQLRGLNVTPEQIDAWVAEGKIISNKHQRVKEAIAQFVDESIVRPNAAERPGWANNPYFAMVWQLKSFYYAYGKNIMGGLGRLAKTKAGQENMTAGVGPLIMGAVLLAPLTMIGLEIRELLKYLLGGGDSRKLRTNNMDFGEYGFEILDRSGILGPLGLLVPMYEAGKYGDFPLGPAAGPTFERIEDLIFDFEFKQNVPVFGTLL